MKNQLSNDLDVLSSCVDDITDMFAHSLDEMSDPTHQHHQAFPMQPKSYGTAEDSKRLKDWAVSVVKCGLDAKSKAFEVSLFFFFIDTS